MHASAKQADHFKQIAMECKCRVVRASSFRKGRAAGWMSAQPAPGQAEG